MKKSLSLIVASAMAFSAFASAAFADEMTAQQKFDALKAAGIFNGYPDGSAGLDKEMTRAEFAKVLALLEGLNANASASTYTDVAANHWAKGYIGAVTEAKLMNGLGAGKFGPNGKVTVEQIAKVADLLAGIEPAGEVAGTSAWATGYVAAAVKAGIIPEMDSYKGNAKRELLVDVAYEIANKVAALSLSKAEQTNNREITVSFNRAASADEQKALTYDLKNGLINYPVTAKWAADGKSVVLTSNYLPAAEYDLTVKGFNPVKVKVEDEKPAKIEITANSLQKANDQDLGVKLYNQFGKEIANPSLNVSVYNATKGLTISPDANGKYDLADDAVAKVDDNVIVTVTHSSGLSVTKTFKVVAGSAATAIKLGAVAPLDGKTRITVGDDDLVVPVELTDQYGTKIKLAETAQTTVTSATYFQNAGITFMLSQAGVIGAYSVDKDGVLKIDVDKAGTVVINAINPATGATGSTTVKVEGTAVVKTLQLSNPGVLVAAGEEVKIPFAAADQFGAALAGKDFTLGSAADQVNISSTVPFATGYPKINGKGELVVKFAPVANDTTSYIYAYVNGAQVGSLTLDVKKAAAPVAINGIKDVQTTLVNGVSVDFDQDNMTYSDTYNRTQSVTASTYSVVSGTPGVVAYENGKLKAVGEGTSEITVSLNGVTNSSYKFTVTVVKADAVKTYAIKTIGTIYGKSDATTASPYAKTVELIGKLSNGAEVAISQDASFDFVTTSDATKIAVNGKNIVGLDEGKATIAAYKGATKLAEQEVTVSKAAPVAAKVSFDKAEYTPTGNTIDFGVNSGDNKVTVQDQYGVNLTTAGFFASSDTNVATVDQNGVVTKVKAGQVTITYITSNGVSGTATVIFE